MLLCCCYLLLYTPRCRELKELRRRQTARQEEKRRHAYAVSPGSGPQEVVSLAS
jgi:hypothetical protein